MVTSPAVMTTTIVEVTPDGQRLSLLVLWRGTPGWFASGGRSGSGGGVAGNIVSHRFYEGGFEFEVTVDLATRIAKIAGNDIALADVNTVLVDGVDSPAGPKVVRTLLVDGTLGNSPGPDRVFPVLGRSKELRDYLRCDASLPNQGMQQALASICARILATSP